MCRSCEIESFGCHQKGIFLAWHWLWQCKWSCSSFGLPTTPLVLWKMRTYTFNRIYETSRCLAYKHANFLQTMRYVLPCAARNQLLNKMLIYKGAETIFSSIRIAQTDDYGTFPALSYTTSLSDFFIFPKVDAYRILVISRAKLMECFQKFLEGLFINFVTCDKSVWASNWSYSRRHVGLTHDFSDFHLSLPSRRFCVMLV